MNAQHGGPAFPVPAQDVQTIEGRRFDLREEGMTLRDYFAAKAMAVLLDSQNKFIASSAADCYKYADAMLEARKK